MRLLMQRGDLGEFRRRYRWMFVLVVLTFLMLTARLMQLQIVEGEEHQAQALRNVVGRITLATTRGVIRDSQGKVLAANRPSYNVYVVPAVIDMKETWPQLVRLMDLSDDEAAELAGKIRKIRAEADLKRKQDDDDPKSGGRHSEGRDWQQTLLKMDVGRDVVAALKTEEAQLPGVEVVAVPVRYYPYPEIASQLIGYMREVDADDLARPGDNGYRAGDRVGAIGVEHRWESYLRGQRGWEKVLRGPRAARERATAKAKYLEPPYREEPIPGRDISMTLDIELQASIERAMRGQLAGAVAVVDVRSGRVLAAFSKPTFDANVLSGGNGVDAVREAFGRLLNDPLKPTLDKTISAAYPPGSTYKPFSALAGLSDGLLDPKARVDCRGGYEYGRRYFRCTGVHRNVDLHDAIMESCNTYFYTLGDRISIDRLASMGLDFGFGVRTGVGTNPESRGRMPTRAWYARRYKGEGFRGGFTLLSAIGQGATTVTVMQLALAYAALANGGTLYQPQVVRSIETSDGTVVQDFPPRVRRIVSIAPDHLKLIAGALRDVVDNKKGTAYKERIEGVSIAGKTGTAQMTHVTPKGVDPEKVWYFNRDHAWFAGYAPAESPEIAIVVLIEHGGGGGKNAVPVAMRVVRDWQELKSQRLTAKAAAKAAAQGGPL
ncbi:MAG TPA: penicillin-binding protein 2 [Polyangiaceae bacterium]|nr:penicillin-binding protein 2 [Polyangiaceae bacterium]